MQKSVSKPNAPFSYRNVQFTLLHIVLFVTAFLVMVPVIWMLLLSLKTESELVTETLTIFPKEWQWQNYVLALTEIDFMRYTVNSITLAFLFSTLTAMSSGLAGYAFAKLPARGREQLFSIVIALLLIPVGVYIIPQFILFTNMKIVDTYWPWVFLGIAGSPFHIFLFRQFFMAFPREIEEAAEVDGASVYRTFFQIVLPNAKAVLATSFILNFLFIWGDFVTPILYLSNENTTLAAVLAGAGYTNQQGYPITTLKLAGSALYTIPPVLIFIFFQKYILQGVVTSGLKG